MWLPNQQSTLTELFQTALIKLCSENIPFEGHLELDGLVCISNGDISRQIVVKIHKVIEPKVQKLTSATKTGGRSLLKPYNELFGGSNPGVLNSGGLNSGVLHSGGLSSSSAVPSESLLTFQTDQKKPLGSERYAIPILLGGLDFSKQSIVGGDSFNYLNGLAVRPEHKQEISVAHSNSAALVESSSRVQIDKSSTSSSVKHAAETSGPDQGDKAMCLITRSPADAEKREGSTDIGARPMFVRPIVVSPRHALIPTKQSLNSSILRLLNVEQPKSIATDTISTAETDSRKRPYPDEDVEIRVKKECLEEKGHSDGGLIGSILPEMNPDDSLEDVPGAPTSCRLCNVPCTGRSLEVHMRCVHKRFLCKICFNAFTLSCNLRRHMKLHAGVRPHACEHCDSSFSRSTDLRIHMRKHGVFESPEGGRSRGIASGDSVPRRCHLCPKIFTGMSSLNRHLYRTHNTKSSANRACHICEKVFESHANLVEHQRTHENSLVEHGGHRQLNFDELRDADDGHSYDEFDEDDDDAGTGVEDVSISGTQQILTSLHKHDSCEHSIENNNNKCETEICVRDAIDELGDPSEVTELNGQGTVAKHDFVECGLNAKYSDTMRDFVPLFNLVDDDDETLNLSMRDGAEALEDKTNSHSSSTANTSPVSSSMGGSCSTSSQGNGSRSKRKGLPIKHIESIATAGDSLELTDVSMETGTKNKIDNVTGENKMKNCDVTGETKNTNSDVTGGTTRKMEREEEEWDSDRVRNSTVSPGEELEEKVFTCRHGGCATSWYGYAAYENHYATTHYRFPCTMCDQSFTSRNNRRRHAASHTDGKRHPCETCGKLFARPDIVKEHRLTHTRSYQSGRCCICGVTCVKKVLLLSHLKKCFRTADDIDDDIAKTESSSGSSTSDVERKVVDRVLYVVDGPESAVSRLS